MKIREELLKNIRQVEPYVPGEQPQEQVVKLNTNENPYPPSPEVKKGSGFSGYGCIPSVSGSGVQCARKGARRAVSCGGGSGVCRRRLRRCAFLMFPDVF